MRFREPRLNFPFTVEIIKGQNVSLFRSFVEIGINLGFVDGWSHLIQISTRWFIIGEIDCSEGLVVTGRLWFLNLIFSTVFVARFHDFMGCDRPRLAAELF